MTAEMFARSAGIELTRIPYKGNGQAIGDLIGGHLSMMVLSLSPILGNVKDGKLFALAVTTPDRSKLLPDVPTIAESALPGFSAAIRYGLAAPAGTSAAIVDRLARELRAAVMSEDVQERMLSEIDRFSPESLMTQWLSAFPQNAERMQEMFAKIFMAGFGQGRH